MNNGYTLHTIQLIVESISEHSDEVIDAITNEDTVHDAKSLFEMVEGNFTPEPLYTKEEVIDIIERVLQDSDRLLDYMTNEDTNEFLESIVEDNIAE